MRELKRTEYLQINVRVKTYRESFVNSADLFTTLRFTATGALLAAKSIRILPMNMYASWPITFEMKENY
jgi:hypothetical protein